MMDVVVKVLLVGIIFGFLIALQTGNILHVISGMFVVYILFLVYDEYFSKKSDNKERD